MGPALIPRGPSPLQHLATFEDSLARLPDRHFPRRRRRRSARLLAQLLEELVGGELDFLDRLSQRRLGHRPTGDPRAVGDDPLPRYTLPRLRAGLRAQIPP